METQTEDLETLEEQTRIQLLTRGNYTCNTKPISREPNKPHYQNTLHMNNEIIENAQKILAQIPIMETAERSRLLEFSKAAYGFVSWYRSAFNFSLAQQDIWENLQDVLINAPIPAPASLNNDMPIQQTPVVTPERKTTKTYKKKETTEIRPSKIEKQLQPAKHEPVFANALTIPAPRIISLRKMI
jgi:hypothetical protein